MTIFSPQNRALLVFRYQTAHITRCNTLENTYWWTSGNPVHPYRIPVKLALYLLSFQCVLAAKQIQIVNCTLFSLLLSRPIQEPQFFSKRKFFSFSSIQAPVPAVCQTQKIRSWIIAILSFLVYSAAPFYLMSNESAFSFYELPFLIFVVWW